MSLDQTIKVFHSPSQDLRWLNTDFYVRVNNHFDTGRAAKFLKLTNLLNKKQNDSSSLQEALCKLRHTAAYKQASATDSLAMLVRSVFGMELDKTHQTSDWRLRPLPLSMLLYAAKDAWILIPLAIALTLQIHFLDPLNVIDPLNGLWKDSLSVSGDTNRTRRAMRYLSEKCQTAATNVAPGLRLEIQCFKWNVG